MLSNGSVASAGPKDVFDGEEASPDPDFWVEKVMKPDHESVVASGSSMGVPNTSR